MVPWPLLALVPQPSSSFLFSSYPCSLALVRTYLLALPLLAVAVDGGGGEVLEGQEALERVGLGLGLDEDEGEARVLVEELQETGVLVVLLDVLDLTGGVRTGRRACQHPAARTLAPVLRDGRTTWVMFSDVEPTRPMVRNT